MRAAFAACGYDEAYGKVTISNRPDLCEYQCNGALAAAKAYRKKPIDIAGEVADHLRDKGKAVFSEVSAVMPGFINLKLNGAYLAGYLNQMMTSDRLGAEDTGRGRTVIVDYGGANVAKPLHVGHLRTAIIGECIRRLGNFLGYHMVGDVHLGDWGLQMGLIIEELRDREPGLPYFDENYTGEYPAEAPFTISRLEEIYPAASAKAKADEAFRARAQEATFKLQNGYAPFMAIWKHIMRVSLEDLKKNYASLGVTFDLWKGESDAQPYIPGLIKDLQDKGLAYVSDGALVVDIAQPGDSREFPPCIIRKSDGAALYATSDLGTIIEREKDYHPSEYIYITDKRQELHFIQVFRVARKAGYVKPDTKMIHMMCGTMNGNDGKPFKTRDGGVMRLENLVKEIDDAVYVRIMENRTMGENEARDASRIIGLAALKYGDLSNQASKDYVFDIDRFTSFEGNTGPYILYTIVRIKSILAKYEESLRDAGGSLPERDFGCLGDADCQKQGDAGCAASLKAEILPADSPEAGNLMRKLSAYNEVVESAFEETAPHKLCQFVYELSDAFSGFYNSTMILKEEDEKKKAGYIRLITLTRSVLETCIGLLGFEAPERM